MPKRTDLTIEEKLILAHEEPVSLSAEEVREITEGAMATLPDGLEDFVDDIYDVIYEAVERAIERVAR